MKQPFFARRSFTILLVATFLLPFVFMGTRRALQSNCNDIKQWLPDGFKETADHKWFQAHFPLEQFVLVSWDGCTLDDPRLELMARKLVPPDDTQLPDGETRQFKKVLTGNRLIEELEARYEDLSRNKILKRLEGSLIGKDHFRTCLVVTLDHSVKGLKLRALLEGIRQTAEDCAIPRAALRMGGPPVDNSAIDVEGERTLFRLAGLSAIIGLGISWLCFRSVRLTSMIFFCAILAAGVALAIIYFSGGQVDAIMLTMPSLVYVLALSGAIHIVNYYHDAIRDRGLEGAPTRALGHGWKPCTIATITTALGLGSLCTSQLIPIANFGWYSATGVLATLALLFLLLPAFLSVWPSRQYAEEAAASKARGDKHESVFVRGWCRIGETVIRHNGLIAVGSIVVMGVFALGALRIETSVKLMKLFSPEAEIIKHYEWLEDYLGPLVPMEVVLRIDDEKCKLSFVERMRLAARVEHSIEQLDDVGGALSAATLAPDLSPTKSKSGLPGFNSRQIRDGIVNKRLETHRKEFRDYLTVDEEAGEELWRVSARVWALTDLDYGLFVDDIKQQVEPVLAAYRKAGVEGIDATYTGVVPLVYKAQHELMRGLFTSLELAFVLIAVVMMLVLRSFSAGLISMIPNLFPVVIIFGMMGWLGILVDVGSMMTASVALGVAVDDTIHYLTWFRHGLDEGLDRKGAAMLAYKRCATAMTQTTLIAGLGLAAFAFSTFTPTQRFGYLMLTLLMAALVGDLIFLPAMLSGPLGKFFGRAAQQKRQKAKSGQRQTSEQTLATIPDVSAEPKPAEGDGDAVPRQTRRDKSHRKRSNRSDKTS